MSNRIITAAALIIISNNYLNMLFIDSIAI